MKSYSSFVCIFVFVGLILVLPAYAKLVATYDQAIITIDQIEDDGKIIAENGTIFAVHLSELINDARAFKKKQVRVLYVVMGEKNTIAEIKPAVAPPFEIPARAISREATMAHK